MLPCQHPQLDALTRTVVYPCFVPVAVEDCPQPAVAQENWVMMLALTMDPKVEREMDRKAAQVAGRKVVRPVQKAELESEQARSLEAHSVQVSPH